MSNILKSKYLLGVMIVSAVAVAFVFAMFATTASAQTACSITSTLRVGSKGDQVKCLQAAVGVSADGSFGPKTKAAVVAWQASVGLVADGVFGPKSNTAWSGGGSMSAGLPVGCTSTAGYSPTTGASCASGAVTMTYPAGCTSASGFSPTTGASCATGAVNNQTGPVAAALSSDTPASGYIIGNQATADLAHFTFSGAGTLSSVVLQRTGISDQNTLSNVYLYDGAVRLTDGFSFNNVGQLTMNNLGIAVNGSKVISVRADVAVVTNASTLGITLVSFTASGQTANTVNLKGNEMSYGSGGLATVVVNSANQTVTGTPTVNAGTSAYTVWSNPIQVNTRAVWLKGANFRLTGSAPSDALGNIKLYVDGVATGNAATIGSITGSNYAMLDFSSAPVSLSTGSHTIDLRADVVKGASYTVTVALQQAADLVIYDAQVGVNLAVVKVDGDPDTAYAASSSGVITIATGSASVTVDPSFS
ncbi:MAG TPA: peptidoglycan-binding domain-containing protein, partial [Candidatus Paceibacterota bacterium]